MSIEAIFLDRDGVISRYVNLLSNIEEFELLPRVAEAIKKCNEAEIPCIVFTNQPQIARGLITEEGVDEINSKMERLLESHGAIVKSVYVCPHHPNANLQKYRENCECRKPKPGMLLRAKEEFGLNLSNCVVVGDSWVDIETGKAAGCISVFVKSGESRTKDSKRPDYEMKPDYVFDDLYSIVQAILSGEIKR